MDSYNLTHTGAELDSAVGRALEGFAAADAATKAVQEYLEQQVSSGNISQEEADNLLNNGSVE